MKECDQYEIQVPALWSTLEGSEPERQQIVRTRACMYTASIKAQIAQGSEKIRKVAVHGTFYE